MLADLKTGAGRHAQTRWGGGSRAERARPGGHGRGGGPRGASPPDAVPLRQGGAGGRPASVPVRAARPVWRYVGERLRDLSGRLQAEITDRPSLLGNRAGDELAREATERLADLHARQ